MCKSQACLEEELRMQDSPCSWEKRKSATRLKREEAGPREPISCYLMLWAVASSWEALSPGLLSWRQLGKSAPKKPLPRTTATAATVEAPHKPEAVSSHFTPTTTLRPSCTLSAKEMPSKRELAGAIRSCKQRGWNSNPGPSASASEGRGPCAFCCPASPLYLDHTQAQLRGCWEGQCSLRDLRPRSIPGP